MFADHLCYIEAHVSFLEALGRLCGEEAIQLPALTVLHQKVQVCACLNGAVQRRHKGVVHCTKVHTALSMRT